MNREIWSIQISGAGDASGSLPLGSCRRPEFLARAISRHSVRNRIRIALLTVRKVFTKAFAAVRSGRWQIVATFLLRRLKFRRHSIAEYWKIFSRRRYFVGAYHLTGAQASKQFEHFPAFRHYRGERKRAIVCDSRSSIGARRAGTKYQIMQINYPNLSNSLELWQTSLSNDGRVPSLWAVSSLLACKFQVTWLKFSQTAKQPSLVPGLGRLLKDLRGFESEPLTQRLKLPSSKLELRSPASTSDSAGLEVACGRRPSPTSSSAAFNNISNISCKSLVTICSLQAQISCDLCCDLRRDLAEKMFLFEAPWNFSPQKCTTLFYRVCSWSGGISALRKRSSWKKMLLPSVGQIVYHWLSFFQANAMNAHRRGNAMGMPPYGKVRRRRFRFSN